MEFKGHPSAEELSSYLREESPRCAVIVSAAYFDEALVRLLGDKKEDRRSVDRSSFFS